MIAKTKESMCHILIGRCFVCEEETWIDLENTDTDRDQKLKHAIQTFNKAHKKCEEKKT